MSDLTQAKNLLQIAQRDLRALNGMLDTDVFADEVFGFHIQQAAEKLLKAWLAALGESYPYTHDVALLLKKLEVLEQAIEEYWELTDYNAFAVQMRYDTLGDDDDAIERAEAIAIIQMLFNQVKTEVFFAE
ncbi:MAG: HEPN domain-containing protein [Cyanobacteria bacterium P01_A01_bin.105]